MHIEQARHNKRSTHEPKDKKFTGHQSPNLYFIRSALFAAGIMIAATTSFSANGQNMKNTNETKHDSALVLPKKDLSKTYDASKNFGAASTEKLELVPSTMTPNAGSKTITIKTYTIMNDGKVKRGDGKPYEVSFDDLFNTLRTANFDGKERKVVVKNNGRYVHYFLHENWKAVLVIHEPVMTKTIGQNEKLVEMENKAWPLASNIYKPLTYWKDSSSVLVVTEKGFEGVIKGTLGEVNLLDIFGITKLEGLALGVKKTKNGESLVMTFVNTNKYVEIPMDNEGNITLQMNFREMVIQ